MDSHQGQTMATSLNYAPLPGDVALKVLVDDNSFL